MTTFPPSRVLVAVDLSEPSLSALDAAKALARRWGSTLEVVHVQSPPLLAAWAGPDRPALPSAPPREAERRMKEKLRAACAGFPEASLSVRVAHGWPPGELAELAAKKAAGLVVVGTHGYAGAERLLLGSAAETVLRRARVPVLAVHARREPLAVRRVLAPWNGRPYATRALRYARDLARDLGAELHVLRVVDPRLDESQKLAFVRSLDAVLGAGPDWTLRVREGDPRRHIVLEANSGRYGLVVLSAHRRPLSSDVVLGSAAERVLRHARVPVLAVPSGTPAPRLTLLRPGAKATWRSLESYA